MRTREGRWLIWVVAIATFLSGLANLWSLIRPLGLRSGELAELFALPLVPASRFATMVLGFTLTAAALNVLRRRRLAFAITLVLAMLSIVFHLAQRTGPAEVAAPIVLIAILLYTRPLFVGRVGAPRLSAGLTTLSLLFLMILAYGIAGFWLLDSQQFGRQFNWADSIEQTVRFLLLIGNSSIAPRTAYARWFLQSLYLASAFFVVAALFALFRPLAYRLIIQPQERARALELLADHGHSTLDFFKIWPDKSLFFDRTGNSFLAYGVAHRCAVILGDPVGPPDAIQDTLGQFASYAWTNGWSIGLHQTSPAFLESYAELGLHHLKIGDEAIVDLKQFSLEGKAHKDVRTAINRLTREGVQERLFLPPLPDEVLAQARDVSRAWLQIPGRRERGFTLGWFDDDYVRQSPLMAMMDRDGHMLAFVTLVPCFASGQMTLDLIRRREEAPNGVMDMLIARLIAALQTRGYDAFSLGLAPMSGFQAGEVPTREEQLLHRLFEHLEFMFSFSGLKQFKAKFAARWEPCYMVYGDLLELARMEQALWRLSRLPAGDARRPLLGGLTRRAWEASGGPLRLREPAACARPSPGEQSQSGAGGPDVDGGPP